MKASSFLLALFLGMVPNLAIGETIDESVKRQTEQAKRDVGKLPVFAMTTEALQSGRAVPGMTASVLKAARELTVDTEQTIVKVGESAVEVTKNGDVVTFTFQLMASTAIDQDGRSYFSYAPDEIRRQIWRMQAAQERGIIFEKPKNRAPVWVVTSFMNCMEMYVTCERFDLTRKYMGLTLERNDAEEQAFVASLITTYGRNGVLTRLAVANEAQRRTARIEALMEQSTDATGYLTYDATSGNFKPEMGRIMEVSVTDSDTLIVPNGTVHFMVKVHNRRFDQMTFELQYADGTGLVATAIGNLARTDMRRGSLTDNDDGLYMYVFPTIELPGDLKPGNIQVVASAVDASGEVIVKNRVIGTFDYPVVAQK